MKAPLASTLAAAAAIAASPLLALAASGCAGTVPFGPPGIHRLLVVAPPRPATWACLPDLGFELEWRGPDGGRRRASLEPGGRKEIEIPRGRFQALIAWPRSGDRRLRPAGALYPAALEARATSLLGLPLDGLDDDLDDDLVMLDWLGGYLSSVARDLRRAGRDPAAFDLVRLGAEAAARLTDPWTFPASEAAARLAASTFRADALREPRRVRAVLAWPGPWAPESPLALPPRLEGAEWIAWLAPGEQRFVDARDELFAWSEEGQRAPVIVRRPGG